MAGTTAAAVTAILKACVVLYTVVPPALTRADFKLLSTMVMLKPCDSTWVGVPVMAPLSGLSVSPAGSWPALMLKP